MSPTETRPTTLVDLWPFAGLRVTSGDLELRYIDDAVAEQLALTAADGVHDDDFMPFTVPWTRGTPVEVGRSVLQYQWRMRAETKPEDWRVELAVLRDGQVLGIQGAYAKEYLVLRTAETGSWLGRRFQGAGVGTRMRLMMLHLLFEGLDAEQATSGAFTDNGPSNGVSRRIGYTDNGLERTVRLGEAAVTRRFLLSRDAWDARPDHLRPDVTLEGLTPVRTYLGLDRPSAAS